MVEECIIFDWNEKYELVVERNPYDLFEYLYL